MKCSDCGTIKDVKKLKHLPLPNGKHGWITLTNWTEYCVSCADKEAIKVDEVFKKTMGNSAN